MAWCIDGILKCWMEYFLYKILTLHHHNPYEYKLNFFLKLKKQRLCFCFNAKNEKAMMHAHKTWLGVLMVF